MQLDGDVTLREIKKFRVAETFTDATIIKSMDFHSSGEVFAYSQDSEKDSENSKTIAILRLSDKLEKIFDVKMQKYGAAIIKFIDDENILTTSEMRDDQMRLLNISRNNWKGGPTYIRYFPGHSKAVTSISSHDNLILSGSLDTTVQLWDQRKEQNIDRINFSTPTLAAFHPFGELFAVAINNSTIKIFSQKNVSENVNTFEFEAVDSVEWRGLKFSWSGKLLMVTTNSSSILIIDAATGEQLHNFRGKIKINN